MWKLPVLDARSSAGNADTDVVVVFQDKSKKPAEVARPYTQTMDLLRKGSVFNAKAGSVQFIRLGGKGQAENVLFVGVGSPDELTEEKLRVAGGNVFGRLLAEKVRTVAVHAEVLDSERQYQAFAEGLMLGAYQFHKHKGKDHKQSSEEYNAPAKITLVSGDKNTLKLLEGVADRVQAIAEAVTITRDWSNEPSNFGTPEYYAAEARRLAREYGLKCTVLNEAEAAREKMGLFLAVGQGSEREGKVVVLEYTPKKTPGKAPKTIALVGKGITFDSGGISIKPSLRMEEMKHDMTGAATLLGAILLAARWKVPNRVIAVLAFTENMPDGKAVQPGNVITSRAGKSVEIINTDAEGRLILADILDYAQDFKPDAVIDAATLTGAVTIALGKHCCAILGNDDALIQQLREVGDANHERMWQLPLFDEYMDDLKSDTADMKNSANDGYGGTIRGAIFLKQFIRKGTRWAHLDIAATAYNLSHLSYYPKRGASGSYVRSLAQFTQDF